jgi:hypothetical protein
MKKNLQNCRPGRHSNRAPSVFTSEAFVQSRPFLTSAPDTLALHEQPAYVRVRGLTIVREPATVALPSQQWAETSV